MSKMPNEPNEAVVSTDPVSPAYGNVARLDRSSLPVSTPNERLTNARSSHGVCARAGRLPPTSTAAINAALIVFCITVIDSSEKGDDCGFKTSQCSIRVVEAQFSRRNGRAPRDAFWAELRLIPP